MVDERPHIIHQQKIRVRTTDRDGAQELQQKIIEWSREKLPAILEEILDEADVGNATLRIDKLSLDFKGITAQDFEVELVDQLRKNLPELIEERKITASVDTSSEDTATWIVSEEDSVAIVTYFLEHGVKPWWVRPNEKIQTYWQEAWNKRPSELAVAIRSLPQKDVVQRRLKTFAGTIERWKIVVHWHRELPKVLNNLAQEVETLSARTLPQSIYVPPQVDSIMEHPATMPLLAVTRSADLNTAVLNLWWTAHTVSSREDATTATKALAADLHRALKSEPTLASSLVILPTLPALTTSPSENESKIDRSPQSVSPASKSPDAAVSEVRPDQDAIQSLSEEKSQSASESGLEDQTDKEEALSGAEPNQPVSSKSEPQEDVLATENSDPQKTEQRVETSAAPEAKPDAESKADTTPEAASILNKENPTQHKAEDDTDSASDHTAKHSREVETTAGDETKESLSTSSAKSPDGAEPTAVENSIDGGRDQIEKKSEPIPPPKEVDELSELASPSKRARGDHPPIEIPTDQASPQQDGELSTSAPDPSTSGVEEAHDASTRADEVIAMESAPVESPAAKKTITPYVPPTGGDEAGWDPAYRHLRPQPEKRYHPEYEKLLSEIPEWAEYYQQGSLDQVWIANAGLALLWAFLPGYFKAAGLLEDGQFKDDEARFRAVWLLQYLAYGKSAQEEEAELFFNKLLVGIDPGEFIEPVTPTVSEMTAGDELLQNVIGMWPALKGVDIDGFRQAFVQHIGHISRDGNGWTVRVESQTHDILIQFLPWSFGVIKLPWMNELIFVEWPTQH